MTIETTQQTETVRQVLYRMLEEWESQVRGVDGLPRIAEIDAFLDKSESRVRTALTTSPVEGPSRAEQDPPARETSPLDIVGASPSESEVPEPTTMPIPHYHVGQNIPGYSPMEIPWVHEDYEDARQDLLGHLDPESLTDEWDGPDRERWERLAQQWDEVAAEVARLPHGTGYGAIVPLSFSEHDLGLAVWLSECSETCEVPED